MVDTICETISTGYDTIYELEFDDSCMRECDRVETICTSTLSMMKTFKKTLQDSISVYYMASNVGLWCPLKPAIENELKATKRWIMAEDFERLKAVRGAHRKVVTKLTKQAEEILKNESLVSEDYERLFVIYQQLDTKLQTLNDYDQKVLNVCDVVDIENEIEESQQAVEKVMGCERQKIDLKIKQRASESRDTWRDNHSESNASTGQAPSRTS